jgi:hypothetical protein
MPAGRLEAASITPAGASRPAIEQAAHNHVVEVAKKRKRRQRTSKQAPEEPASTPLEAAPGDTLITGGVADILLKPLTPAASYRAGQSVFFDVVVARRKGVRAKQIRLEIAAAGVSVTGPKGVSTKTANDLTSVDVPLGTRQKLMLEVKVAAPLGPATQESRIAIRLREKEDGPVVGEGGLAFIVTDCATAYHRALGTLYASREAIYAEVLKQVSAADESLPGEWLFAPRKRSKREVDGSRRVLLPPRAECRWSVNTVDFSTRESKRLCKRWAIVDFGAPASVRSMPVIDEEAAANVVRRASIFVASRGAAGDFGKKGRLEWISRRILTDLRGYMQQSPHPAICTGVEVMTRYFVDNAVTLRKELDASSSSVETARRIAAQRLEALAMVLGREPEEPATTASLSLVTPANAAPDDMPPVLDLLGQAGRLLLTDGRRLRLEATARSADKLALLHDLLAEPGGLAHSEAVQPYLADALTSLEAAVYLEAVDARYAGVGAAIFGSISDIEKTHATSCGCAQ